MREPKKVSVSGYSSSPARSEEPRARRPEETKAANSFIKALNVLSCDEGLIAATFAMAPVAVQARLMRIFRKWVDVLESQFDRGFHENNEHLDIQREAKRLNDGMRPYEE